MSKGRHFSGFLARLRRDRRGNVLAIAAVALLPMIAVSGVAIDTARLYFVKVRIQQACDAGVLAGRKFMTDTSTTNTTLDSTATARAQQFFANNFRAGWFSSASPTFTPTKTSDAQVAGTATVVVPMSIMSIFGVGSKTLSVSCKARYDVADTDIMFVLDTTGSMACLPADSDATCDTYVGNAGTTSYARPSDSAAGNESMAGYPGITAYYVPEKSGSRIAALRAAVLSFYDTMAANVDATTHIRYGFATYTSTVNAGKAITAISPSYMVGGSGNATTSWTYQSRKVTGDYVKSTSTSSNNLSQANCTASSTRTPAATASNSYTYSTSTSTATIATQGWSTSSGKCQVTTQTVGPVWTYGQYPLDLASFVAGITVTDPTKIDGTTSQWDGCVEERGTTAGQSSFATGSLPSDLDPDLIPSSDATRWRPLWDDVEYARSNWGSTSTVTSNGDSSTNPNVGTATYLKAGYVSCGKPVKRIQTLTRAQVATYVNASDFRAIGGTYHDIGMIWGTRMIDPNGVFASDTAAWSGRSAPNRVLVFLTDGDISPSTYIYGGYGIEYYDKRVANGDSANLKNYHNARFLAECAAAKALNIDVWTVTIGSSATSQMQACATTTSQALYTTDGSGLATAFATIAKQVALLRISK